MFKKTGTAKKYFCKTFILLLLLASIHAFFPDQSFAQRPDILKNVIQKYSQLNKENTDKTDKNIDVTSHESSDFSNAPQQSSMLTGAAKIDLSIILALHPDMAFYSPVKHRFIKKFDLGNNEDETLFNYNELNKKVLENEKIFNKDKLKLAREIKALEKRFFSLRIDKNKKINDLRLKLNQDLLGTPKLQMARKETHDLRPDSASDNNSDQKDLNSGMTSLTEEEKNNLKNIFEASLNQIEKDFINDSEKVSKSIENLKSQFDTLIEKIESPMYHTKKESLEIIKKILGEINDITTDTASKSGYSLVFNDSFGRYKYERLSLPNETGSMDISNPSYPSDEISAYLKALAKKAPSEDPEVKNIPGHEETLIFYIRDHLFSDASVKNFYSPYYSQGFMFGKIKDLTNKVLDAILKKHGFSDNKIDLVLKALEKN
jgi:hypothetical protein